jgi:hypothetical protein
VAVFAALQVLTAADDSPDWAERDVILFGSTNTAWELV